ncbi:type II toxin-antitoxin system VapC family toxin [Microaerobacter geothermalis]|uniref:type II toxin-antitoxin system VapC family toxin n=1 Tax=Microaerobacter geothermalis TaxID=674972 RepID=UPI001F3A95DA|nr:PIN domain-containing protein [Microaerobacter geothermalis]
MWNSSITLTEILTKPIHDGNYQLETDYRALFYHFPNLRVAPVDISVAERVSFFRAKYGIRTPDAIIIATAIEYGAHVLLTNDNRLEKIKEIRVVSMSELAEMVCEM